MRVEYVGHATVLVELDGVRLLTDPVLRRRVAHLRRTAPPISTDLGRLDAVLISHAHYDHLDLPSLERLGRSTTIAAPKGVGRTLRRRGFEHVVELLEGDELPVGDVTVRATYADHHGGRGPFVRGAAALGYALTGSRRVFFAGDTDLFPGMSGLVPDLDLALDARVGLGCHPRRRPSQSAARRGGAEPARDHGARSRSTGGPSCLSTAAREPISCAVRSRSSSRPRERRPLTSRFAC